MQLLVESRREERAARAQWFCTLNEFQDRATPSSIAGEAWEGLAETVAEFTERAVDAAKRRPGTIAALGSALVLLLFRKQIGSAIGSRIAGKRAVEETGKAGRALQSQEETR